MHAWGKGAIRDQVKTYKTHYHLIHEGDYYRLSDPAKDKLYTAWAHVSPDRREALAALVAGGARPAPSFRSLRLKGLDPTLQYRINGGTAVYSGEALMQAGYPLPLFHGGYLSLQFYLSAQ